MNYLVTLSLLLSLGSAFAQSDFFGGSSIGGSSTLDSCRSRNAESFACGECETPLQDDFTELLGQLTGQPAGARWSDGFNGEAPIGTNFPDGTPITLEATLSRIKDMMKSNNPEGGNGLNYMVIGQSESLQDTSIRDGKMYPRIAIKSPNSELWVTFNTDPMSEAYQTLEVMRWNGKDAKYDFVELDFGKKDPANPAANRPAKFDGTGQKCIACHKEPDPRPNWETYRAWSGIVPSRDDMIEIDKKHGRPVTEGGEPVGMDGRAYLSFLEQVVDTKEGQNITPGADRRLALLDIPVDDKIQFRDRNPAVSSLSPRAQLDAIKAQASANDGFYRIPHFPYKGQGGAMSNFDSKTAQYAGPSQFAFDQMSGQNFCRISQRLIEDENYNKFKWIVAGISQCGASYDLEEWIPESYRAEIARYFSANPQVLFSDLASAGQLPPAGALSFSAVSNLLTRDTERNHERADEFKRDRHQRMGTSYLTAVEGGDPAQSATQAEFFASQFTAPERYGFHAIDDFGGVNGVTNSEVSEISALRAVLEPMGIDPGKWSLMRGPNTATDYDSLAFSDQFVLLFNQRAIVKAMEDIRTDPAFSDPSAGGNRCEAMKIASNRDLSTIQPQPQENQMSGGTLAALCGGGTLQGLPDPQVVSPMIQVMRAEATPRAKELFSRCVRCHGANANATPFEGMEAMTTTTTPGVAGVQTTPWSDDAWERFNAFLATGMSYYGDGPMGVEMSARLRSHSMPSGGWQVPGETPAQKLANDNLRREELARYVELTFALSDNPAGLEQLCRSISNAANVETTPTTPAQPTSPGAGTR